MWEAEAQPSRPHSRNSERPPVGLEPSGGGGRGGTGLLPPSNPALSLPYHRSGSLGHSLINILWQHPTSKSSQGTRPTTTWPRFGTRNDETLSRPPLLTCPWHRPAGKPKNTQVALGVGLLGAQGQRSK